MPAVTDALRSRPGIPVRAMILLLPLAQFIVSGPSRVEDHRPR
jgi:hypothetical protein